MQASNVFKKVLVSAAVVLGMWGSIGKAADTGPVIEERGEGQAMIFIPGLNSGSETFTETCDAFEQRYRCLLVKLPGFAGQPPMDISQGYLQTTRDAIIRVLREHHADHAVLVGHSLGGVLSMMIALEAPELVDKLVLVEAQPFAAANQHPELTAAQTRFGAEKMRERSAAMTDEQYQAASLQNLSTTTRSEERQAQLRSWVLASDRSTTIAALIDMMVTDLREPISQLRQPVLVLGAGAVYAKYGVTLEGTRAMYLAQFAKAPSVEVHISENSYHFVTWDDTEWVNTRISEFLTTHDTTKTISSVAPKAASKATSN